jgi:hypothetical protein
MTEIAEFLYPPPRHKPIGGIVLWWESRRLSYNLIVGATGSVSFTFAMVMSHLPPDPNPGPPWVLPIVYALAAHLCYFFGPMLETLAETIWGRRMLPVGPALFRIGLTFSVCLTLLPIPITVYDWLIRIVRSVLF